LPNKKELNEEARMRKRYASFIFMSAVSFAFLFVPVSFCQPREQMVKVPGHYSWGFNDTVCPPTSMYVACNAIQEVDAALKRIIDIKAKYRLF
jgi:hypothetical protein